MIYALTMFSCQEPSTLDANKKITVVYDPNNQPSVFQVVPDEIDFKLVHPGKSYSKEIVIRNISNNSVVINSINAKKYKDNFLFYTSYPIELGAKSSNESEKMVELVFTSADHGEFVDIIEWSDYKNPQTIIKAQVASVWANDIKFTDTKIGNLDLKVLNIINSSNNDATITEFTLIDEDNVFIIEPEYTTPQIIPAKSSSKNIFITFNPNADKVFNSKIILKAKYEGTNTHFTDEIIELEGKGNY